MARNAIPTLPTPRTVVRSRSSSSSSAGSDEEKLARKLEKLEEVDANIMWITREDAAFIEGNLAGKTKDRIAEVSGASCAIGGGGTELEFRGTAMQRRRGRKYAQCIMSQRTGPVDITQENDDGDLTLINVPNEAVGFVTGQHGNFLKTIEEEWRVLMFFVNVNKMSIWRRDCEQLAIFGSIRNRRGAELKILCAVETKVPGYYASIRDEVFNRDKYKDATRTWGTSTMMFQDEEMSYALGKQGGTRKKLARSSGAVVQYVGQICMISGTIPQRKRAREYMMWLFDQLEGPVYVDGWEGRTDCTVVDIPNDCIGYITGNRRATLGLMEEEWGTLMFFMSKTDSFHLGRGRSGASSASGLKEKLVIFGPQRGRRGAELKVMSGVETKAPGFYTRQLRDTQSEKSGFDTDRLIFRDDELSYCLGKEGSTRKKLELTSGAILQYVGNVAFIAGIRKERERCREYVNWLLQQRKGAVTVSDISQREDVIEVKIPENCKGWVSGNRGSELRRIEKCTETYIFMAYDAKREERLLIFGVKAGTTTSSLGRTAAERAIRELVREKLSDDDSRATDNRRRYSSRSSSSSRSPSRRQRSRSRSFPRRMPQ